jgi:hypothetical protein
LEFDIVCPNTHNKAVTFNQEEFEETLNPAPWYFIATRATPTGLLPRKKSPGFEAVRQEFELNSPL